MCVCGCFIFGMCVSLPINVCACRPGLHILLQRLCPCFSVNTSFFHVQQRGWKGRERASSSASICSLSRFFSHQISFVTLFLPSWPSFISHHLSLCGVCCFSVCVGISRWCYLVYVCVWETVCGVVVVRDQQMTSPSLQGVCLLSSWNAGLWKYLNSWNVCVCICVRVKMNTSIESTLISGSSLKLVARKMCRPSKDTLQHLFFIALRDRTSCWYTLSCQINHAVNSFIKYPPFNRQSTCSCKIMGSEVLLAWWTIHSVLWITWLKLKPALSEEPLLNSI